MSSNNNNSSSSEGNKPGVSQSALEIPPEETIFAKIASGAIPSKTVYEDEHVRVFEDLNPQAPTHLLIISKKLAVGQCHKALQSDAAAMELGHLLVAAGKVAKQLGLDDELNSGYRLVINNGVGAQQSVNYLHIHMLAGRPFKWPPG